MVFWLLSLNVKLRHHNRRALFSLRALSLSLSRFSTLWHEIEVSTFYATLLCSSIARQINIPKWTIKLTSEPLLLACHFGNVYIWIILRDPCWTQLNLHRSKSQLLSWRCDRSHEKKKRYFRFYSNRLAVFIYISVDGIDFFFCVAINSVWDERWKID